MAPANAWSSGTKRASQVKAASWITGTGLAATNATASTRPAHSACACSDARMPDSSAKSAGDQPRSAIILRNVTSVPGGGRPDVDAPAPQVGDLRHPVARGGEHDEGLDHGREQGAHPVVGAAAGEGARAGDRVVERVRLRQPQRHPARRDQRPALSTEPAEPSVWQSIGARRRMVAQQAADRGADLVVDPGHAAGG